MDETYIKDLWNWTVSQDPTFTDRYTFESWKEKLGTNEQYQQDFYDWVSSKDATFSNRRPIDEWKQLVKKKDSFEVTSEGQPLVSEQAIGTSDVSGATGIDNIKDIEQQKLTDYSQTEQALADGTELLKFLQPAAINAIDANAVAEMSVAAAEAKAVAAAAAEAKAIRDEKLFLAAKLGFSKDYKAPEKKSFEAIKEDLAKKLNFNYEGATKEEVDKFESKAKIIYDANVTRINIESPIAEDVAFFTENPRYLERASDEVKKQIEVESRRKAESESAANRKNNKYVQDAGETADKEGLDNAVNELLITGDMSTLINKYGFSTTNYRNNIKTNELFHGSIIAPDGTKFPLLDLTKFKDLQETEKDEVRGDWAEQAYKRNELKGFLLTNAVLRNENAEGNAIGEGVRKYVKEIQAAEDLKIGRAKTVESEEFQNRLGYVNKSLIAEDEDDAVEKLKRYFSKYGFDFEKTGIGDALTVTAKDGTEHSVDLQTFFSDEEEAAKLKAFLTGNVTPIPELGNAEKLEDNLKKEGIINNDAIKVLESFKMEVKDDRVVVVPTLLKHNGVWSKYESFSEAEADAEKAGQLYTFDTEEEAEAFMDYETSASATYAERFARQYLEDKGLSAESLNQYNRYQEIKDVFEVLDRAVFLESAMSEEDIETLKGADEVVYVDGQRLSPKYIAQMREGLEQEKDLLYNAIYGKTDKKYAIQDLDLILNEAFSERAGQAVQVNAQLKGVSEDLEIRAYEEFGTTIEGLESITPKTVQEAEAINNIVTDYKAAKKGKQLAANAYESSTLFYDMKHDKSISRELSEGTEAFQAEWKNGLATGDVSLVIAKFGMFPEILGGMDLNDDDAMEKAAYEISKAMSERADTDSRIMKSWAMADGFLEAWDVINDNPLEFSAVMAASSISMMLAPGMDIIPKTVGIGAVTGAALGSGGGGAGMLAGGIRGGAQGLKVGMSATMMALEYGSAFMEAAEFKGFDLTNPDDALMALNDNYVWSETRERGLKRGLTIGAVDYLSMSLAGRVFKVGSTAGLGKKIGAVAAQGLVLDPLTEGLGEGLAQLSVGDELDWGEIVLEMSGGFFMNAPSMVVNMGLDIKNRKNKGLADNLMDIEFISDEISSDGNITKWANNMQRLGKITPEQNQRIQENVGIRRDAREVISSRGFINNVDLDNSKNRQAVNVRLMELMSAKKELESSSNLRETFSGEISKIKKEISHIAETGQNLEKEEQVSLSDITKERGIETTTDVRGDVTSYSIGKKNFSKENFIKYIDGLSDRKLRRLTAIIKNDNETSELVSGKINEAKKKVGISAETVMPKFLIKTGTQINKQTSRLEDVFETLELEDNTSEVTVFVNNRQDVPTLLSDITPSSEKKVKGGKLLKFKPQELIDAGLATLKTETDAIQKPSTEKVDAPKQPGDSNPLGEGVPGKGTTPEQVETEAVETEVEEKPRVKLPKPVTRVDAKDRAQFEDNTISTERLDGILVAISDKQDSGKKLTPFQKRVAAANQERLDEIVSLKTQAQEVSDLESLIDEAASDEKTQFQLSEGQTEASKKEEQTKDAERLFKELDEQPLAEDAVEIEAPTVTPTPVKVKENNRLLDKIKRFKLKDIIGKKLNLLMADKLKVMLMDETKPYDEKTNPYVMMGGNFFPLMEKLFGKIAWASITDAATTKIIKGAMNGDYSVVYNMGNGGIMSNIIIAEMLDKKIPDDRKVEFYELIKETVLGSGLEQVKPAKKHIQNSTDMNSFFKLLQKEDVKSRAAVMELILPEDLDVESEGKLAQELQGLGISRDGLIEETSESFAKDLKAGAITMVLEVTNKDGVKVSELKKQLDERRVKEKMTKKQYDTAIEDIIASAKMTQEQQEAEGIPSHSNYPYYIRGRAVALMEETVPFYRVIKEYFDDVQARVLGVDKKRAKGLKEGLEDFEERVYTALNKAKQNSVNAENKKAAIQEVLDSEDFKKLKAKDIKVIKPLLEQALELNNAQKIKELLYDAEAPLAKMRRYSAAEAQAAAMTSAMTTSSTSYGISDYVASSYETFINMLSKSFPNVEVLATQAEFDALIKDVYAKSLSTKNQKIYGAVYKGKIYLNPRLRNFNTPIHEFGHIWLNIAKEANPEAYNKGMELITKDDTYINQVKNSDDYKRVIKEMKKQGATQEEIDTYIKEEALATAIGDKGESFVNASVSRNFKEWLTDLFNNIKKMVGISKFTAEQLQNTTTLDEFLQAVTVDLLSGQALFKDSPIGKLSESLQLMTGPNVSMQSIIEIGRRNGFPNESIKVVLLDRGFNAKKINEALEVNFDLITLMPREFGNIEEGAIAGLELFTSIKEKLQRFATEGPRGGVGTTQTKSFSEIREKAQEILKAEPVYQQQAETVQLELQSALDRSLGIRSNTNVKKNIAEVRAKLEERFIGAKTLKDAQRRMRMLIRTSLPKFDRYTRGVINRLNKVINDTTEKNFKGQATKVFNEIEKVRKMVRVNLIKKIKELVKSKSKAAITASKKRRAKGIDAVGQSYFQQVYKVLDAAAQEDVSTLTALQQSIDDEVVISAIEKISNGEVITAKERAMLDLQLALDSFAEISSMDIEQLEQLLADLKVQKAEAIVRFNNRRDAKRQVYTEKREQIEEQVKGDFEMLFDEDGAPKDINEIVRDSRSVYAAIRKMQVWVAIQELTSKFTTNGKIDPSKIKVFFRNNLVHLGTITNILDRGREDGMFTKMFYDKLNEMSESHLEGAFRQEEILNDIVSSVNPKFKSYRKWALSLNKTFDDIEISSVKKMSRITKNEALRIYALYKNPVQREKLISQGFNADAMEEIKEFLGEDNLAIADMVVDYLSNTYFDEVNNVYIQANDVSLGYVENYFPTKTVSSKKLGDMMSNGDFNGIFNAETSPALQERTDTTGDVVLNEAFTDVLSNHIAQMEQYKAYALGVQEMNNILRSDSIKTVLNETGLSMLFKASINYAINPNAGPKQAEGIADWLGRKFIGFALAFKLIQVVKQASSAFGALEDYQTFSKGQSIFVDLPMFAIDYTTSLLGVFTGKTLREGKKISATFKDRLRKNLAGDFYTIELGTKMGTPNWVYKKIQRTKVGRALKSAAGMSTAVGDIAGVLGYMAAYKAAKRRGVPEAEARKLFNKYNTTQQTQRASEKTPMQQSNNSFVKMFTMFLSSPLLMINNTMQGMNSIMRDIGRKGMPKTKDIRKVALNFSVMNALFVAAAHVGMLLHGDDDDKEYAWNKIKDALKGNTLMYSIPYLGAGMQVAANKSSGESGFTNDGTNALVSIVEQVYKGFDRKENKWDVWKATKPLLELSIGSDIDALIGVSDYINGDYDDEVMYEILGITKSYRPGNINVDKKFITIPVNREKKTETNKTSSSMSAEEIRQLLGSSE